MKAIDLVIRKLLPEDLRPLAAQLDAKGMDALMAQVALRYPDRYAQIADKLVQLGAKAAYQQGETLTLEDMRPVLDMKAVYARMDEEIADAQKANPDPDDFKSARESIWYRYSDEIEKATSEASMARGTGLAYAVTSGARGKPAQMKAMVSTPALYADSKDRLIPIFVRHSFGEGLRPAEYMAGTFGARKSVISTKRCLYKTTLVRMADGGTRELQHIQPEDWVLGATRHGVALPVRVIAVHDNGMQPCHTWTFKAVGADITAGVTCTGDHKFLGAQGLITNIASMGRVLFDSPSFRGGRSFFVLGSTDVGEQPCLDLEVDHPDHLFVLGNGAIVSNSTAQGGDLHKQLSAAAATTVVTEEDCETNNGVALNVEEDKLRGRVLARPIAGWKAGTIIDQQVERALRKSKVKNIVARSAMSCTAKSGVCAHCIGTNGRMEFPPIGEMVGVLAAEAVGEPLAQSALSAKRTGGQASAKQEYTGFNYLNQLLQSPENFQDRAAVADVAGKVEAVREAPQGGHYVKVLGGEERYVPAKLQVTVKPGDMVEAGDQLSSGLVDPREIVDLRGLGEGRRYLARRLKKMMDDGGLKTDLRHAEVLARATLDTVRLDRESEDFDGLPDDILSYNTLMSRYTPPASAKRMKLKEQNVAGKYLAEPALHLTVGTKLTPRLIKELEESGFDSVATQDEEPAFKPDMVRLRTGASDANPDWLARMHTSYVGRHLQESATRGHDTNVLENAHYVPRLAYGENFGAKIRETGKF